MVAELRGEHAIRANRMAGMRTLLSELGQPWENKANCAGQWELFDEVDKALHPQGRMTKNRRKKLDNIIATAAQLCATCPAFAECEASVVPPERKGSEWSYSIIASRVHGSFHPEWKPSQIGFHRSLTADPDPWVECPKGCVKKVRASRMQVHLDRYHDPVSFKHGTAFGYKKHKRMGEQPCYDCVEAQRAHSREMNRRRRERRKNSEQVA